jgi:choline dehydrogenase
MMNTCFDYIVVGAGSAGCLVANRLSADPDARVLLLEAGGWDEGFWLRLPIGYYRTMLDERVSRTFDTQPSRGTADRMIRWPRGRVMGGSSSINGLVFIRGQAEDFDDWAAAGCAGWGYREILPAFKRLERYAGTMSDFRGSVGELPVSDLRNRNALCTAWLEAARQYGLPSNSDFNAQSTHGVGAYQLNIGRRWRASASRAFIHPVRGRRNLFIETGALVERVTFERGIATGVVWSRRGKQHVARCNGEVILSAGAVQSPQLLQLSGVGPASLLQQHGISVVADVPGVGKNLQDHYQVRVVVRMKRKLSLNNQVRNPFSQAAMALQWLVRGSGPLTVGAGQIGGACRTRYATSDRPDIQLTALPLSVDGPGSPLHDFPGFTTVVYQCHPSSRGTVKIKSPSALIAPVIEPNYLAEPIDCKVLAAGFEIVREIHAQSPFRDLMEIEVTPGPAVRTQADIIAYSQRAGGTVFHPVGTCRMGIDAQSVVDPDLRVRGVARLRVVDASVMPSITSANTNAPTYMIAEAACARILGKS